MMRIDDGLNQFVDESTKAINEALYSDVSDDEQMEIYIGDDNESESSL